MERKAIRGIMLTLLLVGVLTFAFNIQPVKASGTIYIRADGSIDPPTANITSVDNVTYTLTDNIDAEIVSGQSAIVVERNNIVVDGAGYTVQGTGNGIGIHLLGRSNVTIKNVKIKAFQSSIAIDYSSNNRIAGNNITNNVVGINVISSSNNTVSENIITGNFNGIELFFSLNNTFSGNTVSKNQNGIHIAYSPLNFLLRNTIIDNDNGVYLADSYSNTVSGNNIRNNNNGVYLRDAPTFNKFYHNNFINNTQQVYIYTYDYSGYANSWDDGYPSGGNYWSDYSGVDLFSGSYQNETGIDGIGDIPYIIDENNVDHYPLMYPWPFRTIVVPSDYLIIQEAINAASPGDRVYVRAGIYYENIVVNKTLSLVGESSETTIIDGSDAGNVTEVTADNVTIMGFTVSKSGGSNSAGGITLRHVRNCIISRNSIINIGSEHPGICLYRSSNNSIYGNNIADTSWGIVLIYSSNNSISRNNIMLNYFGGIGLVNFSNNNIVYRNSIESGVWFGSVYFSESSSNRIYHNNFVNNRGISVYNSVNVWDDGYPSGGNYWGHLGNDTYSGRYQNESGSDGIRDTPYVIDGNNVDRYPSMYPFETMSLLDPSQSEAFQLSLEPIAGGWGVPNTEYRVTLRKTIRFVGDIVSIFDQTPISGIVLQVWNGLTIDTDGNGKNEPSEYNDFLKTLINSIEKTIARASVWDSWKDWAVATQVLSEKLAQVTPLAFSGSVILGGILTTVIPYLRPTMVQGIVAAGISPFPSSFKLTSVSVLSGDFQTISTYSPVDLEVITNSGLVLNRTINEIPEAKYITRDFDEDGELESKVVLPNCTQGYTFRAVPKQGADPFDNYTLAIGADWYQLALIKDNKVQNISRDGYSLTAFNQTSLDQIREKILRNPDVSITNLTSSKTVIGQGYNLQINVLVKNEGNFTETINVTAFANKTFITEIVNITISSGNSTVITFSWNTTGFSKGNYTISAYAWPLFGETDTADNTYVDGTVTVIASRSYLFSRVKQIVIRWPFASSTERIALFKELVDISKQWPYAPP